MRPAVPARVDATVLDAAALLAIALGGRAAASVVPARRPPPTGEPDGRLAGHWRSADGEVELWMAPDGSYRRSVAGRARTARGTCHGTGSALLLCDDTGLRTPITHVGDLLQMAGHDLYRG